jgi:hypothetical protein
MSILLLFESKMAYGPPVNSDTGGLFVPTTAVAVAWVILRAQ